MSEEKRVEIILKWNDDTGEFDPVESKDGDIGVFMSLNKEDSQWIYSYTEGCSLISRRTALRSANGIAKTGYVHPISKIRYGNNFELIQEIDQYKDMPSKLRDPQRSWYQK